MNRDEQQSKPTNEIVKLVLNSNLRNPSPPIQIEIPMPVQLQKVYMYEAETQTSSLSHHEMSDFFSKDVRLTGSNKYGLLALDEYQIIRSGEEHCLKKYFSDDDLSLSDEELTVEKQLAHMNFDEKEDKTVLIENFNNNASIILPTSHSDLLFDDTTHLSATLAQSTSSRISHSRYLQTFKEENDEELDQLVASTVSNQKNLSSIRWFVRQAIDSCRENLTLVDQLLANLPSSSYEHILQRKIHRTNCIINIPNPLKGLQYYPSTSVQTE